MLLEARAVGGGFSEGAERCGRGGWGVEGNLGVSGVFITIFLTRAYMPWFHVSPG